MGLISGIARGRYRNRYSKKVQTPEATLDVIRAEAFSSLAKREIGKTTVTIWLYRSDCYWGKLGDQDAAILRVVTDLHQKQGYKLSRCSLALTFVERDPSGPIIEPVHDPRLQIIQCPAPEYLKGPPVSRHRSTEWAAQIELGAGPVNVGTQPWRQTTDREMARSWIYHGHMDTAHADASAPTVASWEWEANPYNEQVESINKLFSGIVLQHAGQDFWIRTNLDGRLSDAGKRYFFGTSSASSRELGPRVVKLSVDASGDDIQRKADTLPQDVLKSFRGAVAVTVREETVDDVAAQTAN